MHAVTVQFFMTDLPQTHCYQSNPLQNPMRYTNIFQPDQAGHHVGPDLGPNFLHKLSADDIGRQRVK